MRVLLGAAVLLTIAATSDASSLLSLGKTATASSFYNGGCGEIFPAFALTDGLMNDTASGNPCPNGWSFWLGVDNSGNNAVVSIDLGQDYSISSVQIQTTHNRGFDDRGTTSFSLYIGDTPVVFGNTATYGTQVLNAQSLTWTPTSPIPINTFTFGPDTGRYVTLTSLAAINNRSGLNEISVFGDVLAPEPGSFMLAGIAFAAAGLLRKFRH
jgi:hypothetical protein